jgi:hypothetical protein
MIDSRMIMTFGDDQYLADSIEAGAQGFVV